MLLSWNQIRANAAAFAKEFADESREHAEAKPFWEAFLGIFGIHRRRVAAFEHPVKKLNDRSGFIDLLWEGKLLVEHKSRGKDLTAAFRQAKDYFHGLSDAQLPRYVLVSDFARFRLYDLDNDKTYQFTLSELRDKVELFAFLTERTEPINYDEQDPVNIAAAERMGAFHDKLEAFGYRGHQLEIYLVRLLFCLFADDTGIFEKRKMFRLYLKDRTREDGSDLAGALAMLFSTLNTRVEDRMRNLDDDLKAFPYVNGSLFVENLPTAAFDEQLRRELLYAGELNWSKISPAIFGSLFQSAMDKEERRNLGAHYTSEKNILRLIEPLFLDEFYEEFNQAKAAKSLRQLHALHEKIAGLRFLDPACGCGNFLIISYRELRQLEIEIIHEMIRNGEQVASIREYLKVTIDQFYGIEYDEFAARIAEVAMWLMEHQMNLAASDEFGEYILHLPLDTSATIRHGNALRFDWAELLAPEDLDYILGNPPFVGKHLQNKEQAQDMKNIFTVVKNYKSLDYVAAWYLKSAHYIQGTEIRVAFVSTNSIGQGEQVGILWRELLRLGCKIHFAHRTFRWDNQARGVAAVHVIIVGFALFDTERKILFDYEDIKGEPATEQVDNINPYLIEGDDVVVTSRGKPLSPTPPMVYGNKPVDGGGLILSKKEYEEYVTKEPAGKKFIKPLISAREFLHNKERYCFWLVEASPGELRKLPLLMKRIREVRRTREKSVDKGARELAHTPTLFRDTNNPESFILIPRHSSENRSYIPFGLFGKESIPSDSCMIIPDASRFIFGVVQSKMHMVWVSNVCGRLESRFRYSARIVYNNFPFPEDVSDKQKTAVEQAAQAVLDTRKPYLDKGDSLADLYDPLIMPADLCKAHQKLDKAVDRCYRTQPFTGERERIEFLFQEYVKRVGALGL